MPDYTDYAEYYDHDHALWNSVDRPFFLAYAERCGSPILELACGTGRLLIPLARAGYDVTGLDFNQNMLARCREKLESQGLRAQVQLVQASMDEFALARKDFSLVFIAFRSFMHLWTQAQQLACLRRAHEHLRPGGLFILDIYAPNPRYLAQDPERPFSFRHAFILPDGRRVERWDRFVEADLANQISHSEIEYREMGPEGEVLGSKLVPMYTRYTYRWELQLLLERAGFEVLELFRDFERHPFDGTGEIIPVARKPR